jgi:hypothetical protein
MVKPGRSATEVAARENVPLPLSVTPAPCSVAPSDKVTVRATESSPFSNRSAALLSGMSAGQVDLRAAACVRNQAAHASDIRLYRHFFTLPMCIQGDAADRKARIGMRKAKVALARKLAVIMHRMLADGPPFNPPAAKTGPCGSVTRRTAVFGRVTTPGLPRSEVLSPGRWIRLGRNEDGIDRSVMRLTPPPGALLSHEPVGREHDDIGVLSRRQRADPCFRDWRNGHPQRRRSVTARKAWRRRAAVGNSPPR